MLPVYRSTTELSLNKVLTLPHVPLPQSWNRTPAKRQVEFILACDRKCIYFVGWNFTPPWNFENHPAGTKVSGLWERDVFELFLRDDSSTHYQEINLSPAGAWWSASFATPRSEPTVIVGMQGVDVLTHVTPTSVSAAIAIPRQLLKVECEFQNSRGNVCACLGQDERELLSYAKLGGKKADFHQPDSFAPMLAISIY